MNQANPEICVKRKEEVRRIIYKTNPIETFNKNLRKHVENKIVFPNIKDRAKMNH